MDMAEKIEGKLAMQVVTCLSGLYSLKPNPKIILCLPQMRQLVYFTIEHGQLVLTMNKHIIIDGYPFLVGYDSQYNVLALSCEIGLDLSYFEERWK